MQPINIPSMNSTSNSSHHILSALEGHENLHPNIETNQMDNRSLPRVLAIDFDIRGHHADYVLNFANAWARVRPPAQICFLLSSSFIDLHQEVVNVLRQLPESHIALVSLTREEQLRLDRRRRLRHLTGWNLFCHYARKLHASHALFMYGDCFQVPAIIGKTAPCTFSAIYFRPTFHYHTFERADRGFRERFKAWRKQIVLKRFLKCKQLKELYCLDSLAVEYIQSRFVPAPRVSTIADVFSKTPDPEIETSGDQELHELRDQLGIEKGRRIFCLLGVLDSRKGPIQLLESVQYLSPSIGRHVCLLVLGYVPEGDPQGVHAMANRMNNVNGVQIILKDQYIPSDRVQQYYLLSDVILTTYQNHMGSSSALVRACDAGKPILSSDYGYMGEMVRRHGLGITINSISPQEIAKGVSILMPPMPDDLYSPKNAALIASKNGIRQLELDLLHMMDYISRISHPSSPPRGPESSHTNIQA